MRLIFFLAAALSSLSAMAAERMFDFSEFPQDQTPPGFRSLVAGRGKPGDWKVTMDEVPPLLAPLTTKALAVTRRAVLTQRARETIGPHFPILIFDEDTFNDCKVTTRFKLTGGALDQSAGIVFRFQNESNFFVVLASGSSNTFRCTKVVDGVMRPPIGPQIQVARDTWHEMSVQCEGGRILCTLNGQEAIKLIDNSAAGQAGKFGFCTKSDTVAFFADAKVTFASRESLAQKLVRSALKEHSRLRDLKIYSIRLDETTPVVVGSKNEKDLGQPGDAAVQDVLNTGHSYYGKGQQSVTVMLPLRDNNGDTMAAVFLEMNTFAGQTQDNALVRAKPVVKKMQAQVGTREDLLQ